MPIRHRPTVLMTMLVTVLAGAVAGCLPSRVAIDLAPQDASLDETIVIEADSFAGRRNKVALIELNGLISHAPPGGLIRGGSNAVDQIVRQLRKAEQDDRVKAIVLRIESPGGTVAATESIASELDRFRDTSGKPIVASLGTVAASGGYYAALSADEIVAQQGSLTGSIGVLIQTVNVSDGLAKIGIVAPAIVSGPNKALASPLEPVDQGHYRILQDVVDELYAAFRARVIETRPNLSEPDLAMDGRIVTGSRALELGLVDALGGPREAFARAKSLAGLDDAALVRYHAPSDAVGSLYASARLDTPAPTAGTPDSIDLNPLGIDLGESIPGEAGVYYLWRPLP